MSTSTRALGAAALQLLALAGTSQSLAVSASASVGSSQTRSVDESCSNPYERKPWDQLTDDEKSGYIDAELCLMSAAPQLGFSGPQNRWDEIQHTHIAQVDWIHFVGAFLPWHRYYVHIHEKMLRDECGYDGSFPYWNESSSVTIGMNDSSIFQSDTFGHNGNPDDDYCLGDGPFANISLNLDGNNTAVDPYCISREFDQDSLNQSSTASVDECLAYDSFADMWDCVENTPHLAGHSAVGGTLSNVALSPGDPVFFLHHTWLDSLWARWQAVDPDNRMYAIDGTNTPTDEELERSGAPDQDKASFLDYDGDPSNTTTLNHTLWMDGLAVNITIREIMNISNSLNCAVYSY